MKMQLGSKRPRRTALLSAAMMAGMAVSAQGAMLLSDNFTTGNYPGDVPKLTTGATYSWSAGTDPAFPAGDTPALPPRLTEGYDASGGGNTALWGNWDSGAPAILTFDLKAAYAIESVGLNAYFNGDSQGVARVSVETSSDGVNFAPWSDASDPGGLSGNQVLSVNAAAVTAQYVRVTAERYVPAVPSWHHSIVLGEVAIFGSQVPEPSSLIAISSAAAGLILRRRRA
jgi:hypothetical protein